MDTIACFLCHELPTFWGKAVSMFKNSICALLAGVLLAGFSQAQDSKNPKVLIETNMGNITLELFQDKAPNTVKNFLQYVDDKHYEGTIFHRVIDGFMIQGGGMSSAMKEKRTREPIKNESSNGLSNVIGTVAMARTSDPHSATAQFYINVGNNEFLDKSAAKDGYGYCVFGKVVDGSDVVNKIKKIRTGSKGGHQNVPVEEIVIKSVKKVD